jgi:hypothetical protein
MFVVDVFKLLLRHDHEEATTYDNTFADSVDETEFEQMKKDFLQRGKLSVLLLRRLWQTLRLEEATFRAIVLLLERFDIGMISEIDENNDPSVILIPSFFPECLPSKRWPNQAVSI